jgi:hypothetical protein
MKWLLSLFLFTFVFQSFSFAQDYFLATKGPYDPTIPTPESFLGYPIGSHHTRHDQIVNYLQKLAELSDMATFEQYAETYEHRPLIILTISSSGNLDNLEQIRQRHLNINDPSKSEDFQNLPVFVNLGYNVHGNEPSSSEAALLTAYILVASRHPDIENYRQNAVFFIDPVINPDGRDRHTQWANMYKGDPMVSDPADVEHNEAWPRGRTNHYWFDLNRDWWLAVHPESRGKLNWYHHWYPNVVTDFHEMGTNNTHFFEPMKTNGSKDPVMPVENYTTLNETFARYFAKDLDAIGSLYFTKEVFDGTYPGYGSSYPDLQGGLGLLFEQASSRGHVQETPMGDLTFAFTIRNQLTSGFATIEAAVENKNLLHRYQHDFFDTAIENGQKSKIKAYVFGDQKDVNRTRAFIETLLLHRVKMYKLANPINQGEQHFEANTAYVVPTNQPQYRIIQNAFETYHEYHDSVFYDASAWSLVNFYNMPHTALMTNIPLGDEITNQNIQVDIQEVKKSSYAYLIPWDDYYAPAVLSGLLDKEIKITAAFKPFSTMVEGIQMDFDYGTLIIPVQKQEINLDSLHRIITQTTRHFGVQAYQVSTGYHIKGVDLGSNYMKPIEQPKACMLIGGSVSSYEAGEVWHLMDTKIKMPITKVEINQFKRLDLDKYNTLVLVSGNYPELDSFDIKKIKEWVDKGNTMITTREACTWAIRKKLVAEKLIEIKEDEEKDKDNQEVERRPYVNASEELGRERVGGAIFEVELDLSHPLAFGYHQTKIPVYRNSSVWLAPSKNPYCTVAKYTQDPHVDGFITPKNLNEFLKPSASLIVSKIGKGRAIMFADNPNFRGSWYGTNKLFFNALFFGNQIMVPEPQR